jgi:hypothetical protein
LTVPKAIAGPAATSRTWPDTSLSFGFANRKLILVSLKDTFRSMDTRFLETFVIAVDCGSIAEAARRLNLTPAPCRT